MKAKSVLIVGGGVSGLRAANCLGNLGLEVCIVEKAAFAGGHAIGFTCKATEQCVRCGACMVEEQLKYAMDHPGIELLTGCQVERFDRNGGMAVTLKQDPAYVDPQRCTNCGRCYEVCLRTGAVIKGTSAHHRPFYAVDARRCAHLQGEDCRRCIDACPEDAIDLTRKGRTTEKHVDAVVLASGFQAFKPDCQPYGYAEFPDVITTLELETMLRENGRIRRPSNGEAPSRIAFIHCVGSRDAKLGHLWCSKICCAAALRMARLVKHREPEIAVTSFYIDIQSFGRDFDPVYQETRREVELIRAIPGDIVRGQDDRLTAIYLDPETRKSTERRFDMVVLAVGITPSAQSSDAAQTLGLALADTGFVAGDIEGRQDREPFGVFSAGTVRGPMSIADCVASGERAAWRVVKYLDS